MLVLEPGQEALLARRTLTLATLWKLTRVDSTVFYFTDHNRSIAFESNTYTPVGGFSSSAREKVASFEGQNLDVQGILTSGSITHDDLRAGLYKNAEVVEYLVDWKYSWMGALVTNKYWIAEVKYTGENWVATLGGLPRKLKHKAGDVYGRTCRYKLGDALCDIDLSTADAPVTNSFITENSNWDFYSDDMVNDSVAYGSYGARITGTAMPMFETAWSAGIGRLGMIKPEEIIILGVKAPNDDQLDAHFAVSPTYNRYTSWTKSDLGTGHIHIEFLIQGSSPPGFTIQIQAQGGGWVATGIRMNVGVDIKITYAGGDLTCYYRQTGTTSWTQFYNNTETINLGYPMFALDKNSFGGATRVVDVLSVSFNQDLTPQTCIVSDVTSAGLDARRTFEVTGGMMDADYANYGKLTWLTGDNAGLQSEIRDWTPAYPDSVVELQLRSAFTIKVGDTFTMTAGCNKLKGTCVNKFLNLNNFGGFPFIPGTDKLLWTPPSK